MFRVKNRKAHSCASRAAVLTLYDQDHGVLYHGRLYDFPLPEAVILSCSEEFFNDPEPCEIHRRAVQLRVYAEMEMLLEAGKTLPMGDVSPCIRRYCQEMHPHYVRLDQGA